MFKYVKYTEVADKKHVRNAFTGEVVGASGEIHDEFANDARVPENLQFDIYPNDSALLTGLPE